MGSGPEREGRAGGCRSGRIGAWAGAGCAALAALAIYGRTAAPTITWRNSGADSGDLVTAAINLGVPHPSGYPLYTMLAHLWTLIPGEPARNVTLFSAVAAALAVGAVFYAAFWRARASASRTPLALLAAGVAAGLFAWGELLWSQATIAEVYSLHALLVALLVALALSGPARGRPYMLAALFGLALAHHLTILLAVPALWPYARTIRRWLTGRRTLLVGLCLVPGLLAYAYVPLRARAHPVPNWGEAANLPGLAWLVLGMVYRRYLGAVPPAHLLQRLSAWAGIWVRDLGTVGLGLALLGLERGLDGNRCLAWFGLTYVLATSAYALLYVTADSYIYLLPAAVIIALWVAQGAVAAWNGLTGWAKAGRRRRLAAVAGALLLAVLPLGSLVGHWRAMDASADRGAYQYAEAVLEAAAPGAIVVANGDLQTFPLWYVRYGLGRRPDVTVVDRSLLAFAWYRHDLVAREPGLAALVRAGDAQEAATILMQEASRDRPLQLAYADSWLLATAAWQREGPLYTLSHQP